MANTPDQESPGIPLQPFAAPTTLPTVLARLVAFSAVLVASLCGGLIGSSVVDLQCTQQCGLGQLAGAVVGSAFCAAGVALIAVLVLRSKGEWIAEAASQQRKPSRKAQS